MSAMTKPIQIGSQINYTNAGETKINGRDIVPLTNLCGIAQADIAAGETGVLILSGVHEVPAITTAAFTVGQLVYWDATNEKATNVATGNTALGFVTASKAQSAAAARVRIGAPLPAPVGDGCAYANASGAAISAGDIVPLTNMCGVALDDIADSETGALLLEGVFTVPAITTAAFTIGQLVYWDATNKKATNVATSNTALGVVMTAKASAGDKAVVKIGYPVVIPAGTQ